MENLVPTFKFIDPLNGIVVGDWLRIFRFTTEERTIYEIGEVTQLVDEHWVEIQVQGIKKKQFLGNGVFKITRDEAMMYMLES